MEVLGPMPPELLARSRKTREYFDDQGKGRVIILCEVRTDFSSRRLFVEDTNSPANDSEGLRRWPRRAYPAAGGHVRGPSCAVRELSSGYTDA